MKSVKRIFILIVRLAKSLFFSDDIPKIEEIFQRKLTEAAENDYDLNSHPKVKEFREKVWSIHHQGQPMPTADTQQGLEDEDIIMSQVRNRGVM